MSPGTARAWAGLIFQLGAALLATLALALAAAGANARGRARSFWSLLAAGPALWAFAAVRPEPTYGLGELAWVAALLLRPDRQASARPGLRALLGAGAVLCVFAYLHSYLFVLPGPFVEGDVHFARRTALLQALPRAALAVWVFILARTAATDYWRIAFGRLALVFTVWAVGQTVAGYAPVAGYRGGSLAELGWIVPFLLLAAVAMAEGRRHTKPERHLVSVRRSFGAAASLAVLAALPVFHALAGGPAPPALAAARGDLTTLAVAALAAILILREVMAAREAAVARPDLPIRSREHARQIRSRGGVYPSQDG
jgi:hypothetical protein